MQEVSYKATISQWEEFQRSVVWHDLQLFLTERAEDHRDMLELTDKERESSESLKAREPADMIRGRNREIRDLLIFPEVIIQELRESLDEGEE